jgi:hypothetical protein
MQSNTGVGSGKFIFGTGTAPYILDVTDWEFSSDTASDFRFGFFGSETGVFRLYTVGGAAGLPQGTASLGSASGEGTLIHNDGTSAAGVVLGPQTMAGNGTPESVFTARVGSIYMRANGVAGTAAYVKETGTGNTGWDALVSNDGTQTLINKTLLDTTTIFGNTATPSKAFKFDLSGSTAAITTTLATTSTMARTVTLPDASITVPGDVTQTCGTAAAGSAAVCAETNISTTAKFVVGTVAMDGATPSIAAITSMPSFTSTTSYACVVTGQTVTTDTFKAINVSATAFTITGPAASVSVVSYLCAGN